VIPTYNEAENLPKIAAAVLALPINDLNILVVDDNSPDGTGQIAEDLSKQTDGRIQVMHRAGKQGLGTAYIQGFQHCIQTGSEAIGQMDADFSHPVEKLVPMVQAVENCDLAVGSRYIQGGSLDKNWPVWRKALSGWGNFYARTILGLPVHDVTAGFKIWRKNTLEHMPLDRIRSNGYVFQVEMAYVAHRLGFRAVEVPIHFADRRWGQSKMSFKIQIEAAVRVWQLPGNYRELHKIV
jgi:dolichol-phosphate mannosyltransferase